MSDDHPHIFSFFSGPTPEQIEHARMEYEANGHDTKNFFESLSLDQLAKLNGIIYAVIASEGAAGHYYQGIIAGVADYKQNKCMACGRDHKKDEADLLGTPTEPEGQTVLGQVGEHQPVINSGEPSRAMLMDEYGVEPDEGGSERVMCSNCETWYVSLEDRMLRKPKVAGCSGCQKKAAWG